MTAVFDRGAARMADEQELFDIHDTIAGKVCDCCGEVCEATQELNQLDCTFCGDEYAPRAFISAESQLILMRPPRLCAQALLPPRMFGEVFEEHSLREEQKDRLQVPPRLRQGDKIRQTLPWEGTSCAALEAPPSYFADCVLSCDAVHTPLAWLRRRRGAHPAACRLTSRTPFIRGARQPSAGKKRRCSHSRRRPSLRPSPPSLR